jgi:Zn-dependent M28 family amino/carboxypeptidase
VKIRRAVPVLAATLAGAVAVTLVAVQPAAALDQVNTKKLRDAVTVNGILGHERALQRIATENGGTRASSTPGYAASAAYVVKTLRAAGLTVKQQKFSFPYFTDTAEPTLAQVTPTAKTYTTQTMTYSGSGSVTGTVVPAGGIQVPPPAEPGVASGCTAADFTAATGTQVALVQRGGCDFEVKAENALAAGYSAVIIFNEGNASDPDRQGVINGGLADPISIPVLDVSYADGAALYTAAQAGPVTVKLSASTQSDPDASTTNVIADLPGGDADQTVVVGAHLDSVPAGPGINDNGSGTSTILEIAEQFSALKIKPKRHLRFVFFGAEEFGLLGSEHYVENLNDAQLAKIYANLNFDMLGSPNYVRFVYDGDASDIDPGATVVPPGSDAIESVFNDYFAGQKLATEATAFDGRSDYGPFIEAGIPAGGLFSGAEDIKTAEQAKIFGGTAGVALDKCYHQACDTLSNLNTKALEELGDGAAHAVQTLATSKTGLFPDGSRVGPTALKAAAGASSDYRGHLAVR